MLLKAKQSMFKVGDIITYKSHEELDGNDYIHGGKDHGGIKTEVLSIGSFIPSKNCFELQVLSPKSIREHYSMLEFEFKEYDNPNTIKNNKNMSTKHKSVFHTFKLGDREITLCVKNQGGHSVSVGYAVKVKEDTFDQTLAERISSGRADSKARLEADTISPTFQTTSVFKAIAKVWERRITNNPTRYIKGIKQLKKQ